MRLVVNKTFLAELKYDSHEEVISIIVPLAPDGPGFG